MTNNKGALVLALFVILIGCHTPMESQEDSSKSNNENGMLDEEEFAFIPIIHEIARGKATKRNFELLNRLGDSLGSSNGDLYGGLICQYLWLTEYSCSIVEYIGSAQVNDFENIVESIASEYYIDYETDNPQKHLRESLDIECKGLDGDVRALALSRFDASIEFFESVR